MAQSKETRVCYPWTWEVEAGWLLQFWGHPRLHLRPYSPKNNSNNKTPTKQKHNSELIHQSAENDNGNWSVTLWFLACPQNSEQCGFVFRTTNPLCIRLRYTHRASQLPSKQKSPHWGAASCQGWCTCCEHEDLDLFSHHIKGQVRQHLLEILGQRRWHQKDLGSFLESHSSLNSEFQVQRETLSHKIRWREIERDTQHYIDLLSLYMHRYACIYIHMCTYIHITQKLCTKNGGKVYFLITVGITPGVSALLNIWITWAGFHKS